MLRAPSLAASLLAVAASLAQASGPVAPAHPDTTPGGKSEPVDLLTEDGMRLKASFYEPRGSGRRPGIVLLHGAGGSRASFEDLAGRLQRSGFGVLSVDLRGHGESITGSCDWTSLGAEDRGKTWTYALRDLSAAVQYLRSRKEIHASNLTLVGTGEASALAVRYASRDENVRAVVLLAPGGDLFGFDLAGDVCELGGLPTLILAEQSERTTAERLREAGHRKNGGYEYIEIAVLKDSKAAIYENKRLPTEMTRWLKAHVTDKRGG